MEAQLDAAKQSLGRHQERHQNKRGRVSEYPLYLRLLDADAADVPVETLADVLFERVEAKLAVRRVSAALEEARALRDVNYRYV